MYPPPTPLATRPQSHTDGVAKRYRIRGFVHPAIAYLLTRGCNGMGWAAIALRCAAETSRGGIAYLPLPTLPIQNTYLHIYSHVHTWVAMYDYRQGPAYVHTYISAGDQGYGIQIPDLIRGLVEDADTYKGIDG